MKTEKQELREQIWTQLDEEGEARFPFPIEGRIPNFNGSREAAERLSSVDVVRQADVIKVNPDSPQKPVRETLLKQGKTILIPTPRLKGGFHRLEGKEISDDDCSDASTLDGIDRFGTTVSLDDLASVELVVTGSVAVSREGGRIGKGEGYSDLEYAMIREIGGRQPPVVTTVHSIQLVAPFEPDPHDVVLDWIFTPEETIETDPDRSPPDGIDWTLISDEDLEEMPVLKTIRKRASS